jgi:hypothetical protein
MCTTADSTFETTHKTILVHKSRMIHSLNSVFKSKVTNHCYLIVFHEAWIISKLVLSASLLLSTLQLAVAIGVSAYTEFLSHNMLGKPSPCIERNISEKIIYVFTYSLIIPNRLQSPQEQIPYLVYICVSQNTENTFYINSILWKGPFMAEGPIWITMHYFMILLSWEC